MALLEPKEIEIDGKTYVIHKLPATIAIEIMVRGAGAALPNAGDFSVLEAMMIKMMGYVAIRRANLPDLNLGSRELIDNHCVGYKTYLKVLEAMREYNELFFVSGSLSDFSKGLMETLPAKLLKMLIPSLQPSVTPDLQPSTS